MNKESVNNGGAKNISDYEKISKAEEKFQTGYRKEGENYHI